MKIGVPKEIKPNEHRVGLTPASVKEFVTRGHNVVVEAGAGQGIGAGDEVYAAQGAEILPSARDVFAAADMIVKVKEPQKPEWEMLTERHILYTYLHLAPDPNQTKGLLESGCSAVAYETVTDSNGRLPLLAPMSEIAGRLSIQAAAQALEKHAGGVGLLLGGVPGVAACEVIIIGGGVVGTNAAKIAVGMGSRVTILDRSVDRLREIDDLFDGRVQALYASAENVEKATRLADVIVGAVLVPGASAPKLIKRSDLAELKPGALLVDVAIDQGGCFETSKPTTHASPTYKMDDVLHYCVANMPGAVPRTSTYALNNATLLLGLQLADQGLSALETPMLRSGLNIHRGKVTNLTVAEALNLEYSDNISLAA